MPASVTVTGADKASRELKQIAIRARRPTPALKRIGHYLKEISLQAFRDEADPTTGRAWEKLSPLTIERRRNKGKVKILDDIGTLRGSIHHLIIGKQSVAVGSNLVYAGTHQFGRSQSMGRSGGSRVSIPARPFLGVDDAGLKEITRMIRRYLDTGK